MLLRVIEVEVKVGNYSPRVIGTVLEDIFESCRAQDCFATSGNSVQPEERCVIYFPRGILVTLEKPGTSTELAPSKCFLVVVGWIWR